MVYEISNRSQRFSSLHCLFANQSGYRTVFDFLPKNQHRTEEVVAVFKVPIEPALTDTYSFCQAFNPDSFYAFVLKDI